MSSRTIRSRWSDWLRRTEAPVFKSQAQTLIHYFVVEASTAPKEQARQVHRFVGQVGWEAAWCRFPTAVKGDGRPCRGPWWGKSAAFRSAAAPRYGLDIICACSYS
jgi:hypothetical protein